MIHSEEWKMIHSEEWRIIHSSDIWSENNPLIVVCPYMGKQELVDYFLTICQKSGLFYTL